MTETLTKVPSSYNHPVYEIVYEDDEQYMNHLEQRGTTSDIGEGAEVVSSEIGDGTGRQFGPSFTNHTLMIDLDVPATLVPSTTPGHSHLYIDVEMSWKQLRDLLWALWQAGVIEEGYLKASLERGHTSVRLPWLKTRVPEPVAVPL